METLQAYKTTFYTCGCGYQTLNNGNAYRHKKTPCGHEMTSEMKEFVLKEDAVAHSNNITVPLDNSTINGNVIGKIGKYIDQKHVTFNLMVPDADTGRVVYEVLKSEDFQNALSAEFQTENIPAILFKYTKGRYVERPDGDAAVIVKDDKVHEKDAGGNVVKTPLTRYAKKFVGDATRTIETHADILTHRHSKSVVDDFRSRNLPGAKRHEQISGAEALKKYSAGDHETYKYPAETRGYVERAVSAVKDEIRLANT